MAKRDYYEVLGIQKGATEDEIKKAYRKIAMANHPDTHPNDKGAEERFKEASEAYEVLSNPEKRKTYDQYGFAGVDGMAGGAAGNYQNVYRDFSDIFGSGGSSFEDIFGSFFSGGFRQSSRRSRPGAAEPGSTLQYQITIDFKEAAFGTKKEISFVREAKDPACSGLGGTGKKTCPTCGGSGRVASSSGFFQMASTCKTCRGKGYVVENPCSVCHGTGVIKKNERLNVTIPPGTNNGTRLTLRGKGDAGENGGPEGDLILTISVRPDKYFVREGNDVYLQVPVQMTQAALGSSINVPTIDGTMVKVDIPIGTQSGRMLRLKGKGVPEFKGTNRGDMYLKIVIETPRHLSSKAKSLMEELNEEFKPSVTPTPVKFER